MDREVLWWKSLLSLSMEYFILTLNLISAFDEILQMGRDQEVDFVLLGGDLFHDNRPTRNAEHQCMKILKKHVLGDRPVGVELLSDPEMNFAHCDPNHREVNYLNSNLNIALPIFRYAP